MFWFCVNQSDDRKSYIQFWLWPGLYTDHGRNSQIIFGKTIQLKISLTPENYKINADKALLQRLHLAPNIRQGPTPGGEGALPYLAYAGMCRWTGYSVLISLLSILNKVSFWTGSLSKSVKTCDEQTTFVIPIIFFLNISISTILEWKINTLFCMQNKANQDRKVVPPVFNRVAKWGIFVLNRVGVCGPQRHTSTQTSLECPPGGPTSWCGYLCNAGGHLVSFLRRFD